MSSGISEQTIMEQAVPTVDTYLEGAIKNIDRRFGPGYAKAHPELVAAFIQACAADYAAGLQAKGLSAFREDLSESINRLAHVLGMDN